MTCVSLVSASAHAAVCRTGHDCPVAMVSGLSLDVEGIVPPHWANTQRMRELGGCAKEKNRRGRMTGLLHEDPSIVHGAVDCCILNRLKTK